MVDFTSGYEGVDILQLKGGVREREGTELSCTNHSTNHSKHTVHDIEKITNEIKKLPSVPPGK